MWHSVKRYGKLHEEFAVYLTTFNSNKVNTFPLKTVVLLIIYIIKFRHDLKKNHLIIRILVLADFYISLSTK